MDSFIFFILFFTSIFLATQACAENCTTLRYLGTAHIQFPFRVRGQQPDHRGNAIYELDYNKNNGTTTIHIPSYGDLVVKSILYDTKRLKLLDPKNCVHEVFLNLNLSLTPFQYYYAVKEYSYLNCSVRLSSSFIEIPCLSGYGNHVYTVEPSLAVPDSCRVVKTVPIPFGYNPYLSDNSFGLGLTWGSDGDGDPEIIEGRRSLHPKTEQQTECFTMAHVKVGCIAIFIFMVAALIRIKMYWFKKLQCRKEGADQIEVEKLLGEYKSFKLERCEIRQQYSV